MFFDLSRLSLDGSRLSLDGSRLSLDGSRLVSLWMGVVFPFSVLSPGQELSVTSGIDFLLPIETGRLKKSLFTHVVFHW